MQLGAAERSEIIGALREAGCVFAADECALLADAATDRTELDSLVLRRRNGVPLELILGWAEFCGLRIAVAPGVFVPRRRTQLLVREAARLARPGDIVVDMCCGTGAVGRALASRVDVGLYAVDVDSDATACAEGNLAPIGGRVLTGDLFDALPAELSGRIALIVANAPYVPTDEIAFMPSEARLHEHLVALDGGADGVSVHRRIAAAAPEWLTAGGHLLIETSSSHAVLTAGAMQASGFSTTVMHDADVDGTVVIGH